MKVSAIIVNYNSKSSLSECLDSICQKFGESFDWEVIICNNDINEKLEEFKKDGRVEIINFEKNIGFGAASNWGAKIAKGELLFFMNPDAKIENSQIEKIFSEFNPESKAGAIGAKIINTKGKVESWSVGEEITLLNLLLNNLGFSRSRKIWGNISKKEVDWVSGAAFFAKRKTFLESGGFDEDYFLYFEDMDLCKRLRKRGLSIIHFPEFVVRHSGGKSFKNRKEQKRHYYQSMEKYFEKHHGKFSASLIKIARKLFFH